MLEITIAEPRGGRYGREVPVEETVEKRAAKAAYKAEWQRTHPLQVRAAKLRWYHAHKEQARRYYAANRQKILAREKRSYQSNPSPNRLRAKEHYCANRAGKLEYQKRYQKQHREQVRAYRKKHFPKYAVYAQAHRALKRKSAINLEHIESWWATMRAKATVKCYWCQTPTAGNSLHMDHVIPLTKGGAHSVGNLCGACPGCNLSKHAKLPHTWDRHPQVFLSL